MSNRILGLQKTHPKFLKQYICPDLYFLCLKYKISLKRFSMRSRSRWRWTRTRKRRHAWHKIFPDQDDLIKGSVLWYIHHWVFHISCWISIFLLIASLWYIKFILILLSIVQAATGIDRWVPCQSSLREVYNGHTILKSDVMSFGFHSKIHDVFTFLYVHTHLQQQMPSYEYNHGHFMIVSPFIYIICKKKCHRTAWCNSMFNIGHQITFRFNLSPVSAVSIQRQSTFIQWHGDNYIDIKISVVITHPCLGFNGGLTKPPL